MKKYITEIRRVKNYECPLNYGSMSLSFEESTNENAVTFSEGIDKYLSSTSVKNVEELNNILGLRYILNVEIHSSPEIEDIQDIEMGLSKLDKASKDYRVGLETDSKLQVREAIRRTWANLHIVGLYDVKELILNFDAVNLDMSKVEIKDIEKNILFVSEIAQIKNPFTYIIPVNLANKLTTKEYEETTVGKIFNSKIKAYKNVFAEEKGLENKYIRSL